MSAASAPARSAGRLAAGVGSAARAGSHAMCRRGLCHLDHGDDRRCDPGHVTLEAVVTAGTSGHPRQRHHSGAYGTEVAQITENRSLSMPSSREDSSTHRRPHVPSLSEPYLEFDLTREVEQLHHEPEWENGQNARTLVKYDTLRVVLTALHAKERIPEHRTGGRITIQTVRGRIHVRARGR